MVPADATVVDIPGGNEAVLSVTPEIEPLAISVPLTTMSEPLMMIAPPSATERVITSACAGELTASAAKTAATLNDANRDILFLLEPEKIFSAPVSLCDDENAGALSHVVHVRNPLLRFLDAAGERQLMLSRLSLVRTFHRHGFVSIH